MKPEKIWDYIDMGEPDVCWVWLRGRRSDGYGILYLPGGKQVRAHRLSYELSSGKIPDGLFVLHKCDNPPCCNPNHLFIGTQADNLRDMIEKGRRGKTGYKPGSQIGEKNYGSKLTEEDIREIRFYLGSGISHESISIMFDVSRGLITQINTGKIWNHIDMEDYYESN